MTVIRDAEALIDQVSKLVATTEAASLRMTETMAATRGLAPNDVLFSGSVSLAAGSFAWERDFEVPYAAVAVIPFGTVTVAYTVSNSPADGDGAAVTGVGRITPPAASAICVPLVGTHLAIWSTAAASFNVVVLARPTPPWLASYVAT